MSKIKTVFGFDMETDVGSWVPTKHELNRKLPARRHAATFKLIFFIMF